MIILLLCFLLLLLLFIPLFFHYIELLFEFSYQNNFIISLKLFYYKPELIKFEDLFRHAP